MSRLTLSLVAFLLTASIGLGLIFDYAYRAFIQTGSKQADPRLEQIEALLTPLAALMTGAEAQQHIRQLEEELSNAQLAILSEKALSLPQSLKEQLNRGDVLTLEDGQGITLVKQLGLSSDLLVLTLPPDDSTAHNAGVRISFTAIFYMLLVATLLLWLWPLIRRLMVLRRTTRLFGQGQLEARIDVSKISYISDIERDFNQMAQRIENLIGDVKMLSSAVSHDLRTPLAKIRLGLDVLSEEQDLTKRKEYESRIDRHLDDMLELVETMLGYARLEQARLEVELTPQSLTPMLSELTERWGGESKPLAFDVVGAPSSILADAKYLKMALNNVLQNAITHAHREIRVVLQESHGDVLVQISDDGDGIDSASTEDLFKPFVRGKHTQYKGFGMGLAIVQRIVEWHGASIEVDNCPRLGGARFTIRFMARSVVN
jgi:two-component system OmpR family sensor kinase